MNNNTSMDTSDSSHPQQRLINFSKPTPDFNRKFYDLYSQKSMVDVTLSADGQFLQAHKVVLAVASSWFEELFDFLKDKHPVIVLKDLSLQQLNSILEFIYLGSVSVSEDDAGTFKASLESLRISLEDLSQEDQEQDEEHEQEHENENQNENDEEQEAEEDDIEVEDVDETNEEQSSELEWSMKAAEVKIKKEPEWEDTVVVKEEPVEKETVKESPLEQESVNESPLKVASVSHIPPQLAPAINSGTIRIRTPASINEKVKLKEMPPRVVKIVQRLPTVVPAPPVTAQKPNIQELSKRLSKAILIRRVKKSDGSFVSERSPVKIIQGVKIQKVIPGSAQHYVPMRPQIMQQSHMMSGDKRMVPVFRCSHCSKAFSVNKRRNAHEKFCFKNPSRPSSQCPYCPMVLCNPMYIATHIKKVHGIGESVESIEQRLKM